MSVFEATVVHDGVEGEPTEIRFRVDEGFSLHDARIVGEREAKRVACVYNGGNPDDERIRVIKLACDSVQLI